MSSEDWHKVNQLAAKARTGTLNNERAELDEIESVTSFLELMQSKARLSLKNSGLSGWGRRAESSGGWAPGTPETAGSSRPVTLISTAPFTGYSPRCWYSVSSRW